MALHAIRAATLAAASILFVVSLLHAQTQPPDPATHAKAVITQLAQGDFAGVEAQFNDRVRSAMAPGRLSDAWTKLVGQAGLFQKVNEPHVQPAGEFRVVVTQCEFADARVDVQLVFDKDGRIAGLAFRPSAPPPAPYALPAYATPSAYTESELRVGSGDWALPATLEMPVGAGPFPAVVLVAGSGPNDRDETVGANKPFKDLALGLASRGVAVLRYEKRTKVYGSRMATMPDLTVQQEVLDDVSEAVKTLKAQPRIDGSRLVVLGHSLGAMLIPRMAAQNADVAAFVAMAGPARPLEDAILAQTKYLAGAAGQLSQAQKAHLADIETNVAAIKALKPGATGLYSGAPASYWLDLQGYDAPRSATAISRPLLVLQGERDYQVTMPEFERWKTALAGKPNVTFHAYPALNHLFIAGTGQSVPAEYDLAGHVAPDVIDDIAGWIGTLPRRG